MPEPTTLHVDSAPLTPLQQANAAKAEAERVAAEIKATAVDAANIEFQKTVADAAAKRNEALAQFPDYSLTGLARAAWNLVRGSDPAYDDCILSHREKLLTHAESVQRTGVPSESPSDFEIEVSRLLKEQKAKAATQPVFSSRQPVAGEPFNPPVRPATSAEARAEARLSSEPFVSQPPLNPKTSKAPEE